MSSEIDDRVGIPDHSCPIDGILTKGKITPKTKLEEGYVQYEPLYAGKSTPMECGQFAEDMLFWWNKTGYLITNPSGSNFTSLSTEKKQWWWLCKGVSEQLYGTLHVIDKVFWSWEDDTTNAPFERKCVVNFTCSGSSGEESSVSGYTGQQFGSMPTLCTIPTYNSLCTRNKITALVPEECTGLTQMGVYGKTCRDWFSDNLSDAVKATEVNSICERFGWLSECMCLTRNNDELYKDAATLFTNAQASPECWWQPCKLEGNDRLVTPGMEKGRHCCDVNICGNFINAIKNTDINIDNVRQYVQCSSDEEAQIDEIINQGDSTVVGGGSTDVVAVGGYSMSKSTIILIVIGVVILVMVIAGIVAYRTMRKKGKSKSKK